MVQATMDSVPVNLILDTGANVGIAFDKATAKWLKQQGDSTNVAIGLGGAGSGGHARISRATIGDVVLDSLDVATVDLSHIVQAFQFAGTQIDGVIGSVLLARLKAVIDLGSETLYLDPQHDFPRAPPRR